MNTLEKKDVTARASLELLYHVSRELASALDLHTVLQRVLALSIESVQAVRGSLFVLNEHGQPVRSALRVQDRIEPQGAIRLQQQFSHSLAAWVAKHRITAVVADTSLDERWVRLLDENGNGAQAASAICIPLIAREKLVGVLTLVHSQPDFFQPEHQELLQAIADQAGIAILNAQLYDESRRQARVMTALAESGAAITSTLDVNEVLHHILDQISQAIQARYVSLALIDPRREELEFRAATGDDNQDIVGMRLKLGQGIAGWVAQHGEGLLVPDVSKDPRFFSGFDNQLDFHTSAVVCAPIRSEGQVIGTLEAVNSVAGGFDSDALLVLSRIGYFAGSAIRHAQLFERQQAAHQRYYELFEDSINPILITDQTGQILEANHQAELITGLNSPALYLLNVRDLDLLENGETELPVDRLSAGETISYEASLYRQDVEAVPVEVYVRQVQVHQDWHLQWILRDITERQKLDGLREDLLSMIYHDLRSPLANVVSSLDVLASLLPLEDQPALRSLMNIAVRSTERILRLTNSLLDISRLEAGQAVGNRVPVSPHSLVADAVDSVAPTAQSKDLVLQTNLTGDLPEVLADVDMAKRILINLMENAVKFTPPRGKIYVDAKSEGELVQFTVEDTGPGIPAAARERIFDKFTRLRPTEGARGVGLGLAYCRLAVEGHGGRIWVESEPGIGARFHFTLPATPQAPTASSG